MAGSGRFPRIGSHASGGLDGQPSSQKVAYQLSKITKAVLYLAVAQKSRSQSVVRTNGRTDIIASSRAIEAPVAPSKPLVQIENNDLSNPLAGPFQNPEFVDACRALGCVGLIHMVHQSSQWSQIVFNLLSHIASANQQKLICFELGFYAPPGYAHLAKR